MSTDTDTNPGAGTNETRADEDRRKFLASCGRFAAVTPPAVTLLLSTALNSDAVAGSGGGHRNHPDPQPTRGRD